MGVTIGRDVANFLQRAKDHSQHMPTIVANGAKSDPKGAGDFFGLVADLTGMSFAKSACSALSAAGQVFKTAEKCTACGKDAVKQGKIIYDRYELADGLDNGEEVFKHWLKKASIEWVKDTKNLELYLKAGKEAVKFIALFWCPKSKGWKRVKVVFSLGVDAVLQCKQGSFTRLLLEGKLSTEYNQAGPSSEGDEVDATAVDSNRKSSKARVFKEFAYGVSFVGSAFSFAAMVIEPMSKGNSGSLSKIGRIFGKTKGVMLYLYSFNQGLDKAIADSGDTDQL